MNEHEKLEVYKMLQTRNEGDEFEIRFGVFNKTFSPIIDLETFLRINTFVTSFATFEKIEYSFIFSVGNNRLTNILSKPIGNDLLSDIWKNEILSTVTILKKNINKIDIPEYGMRFSLSNEIESPFPEVKEISGLLKIRKRIIYKYQNYSIELSMFKTGYDRISLENSDYYYDVEIEINGVEINYEFIMEFIKVKQDTNFPMPATFEANIVSKYMFLVKSEKFIGVQPEAICNEKIISNEQYAATLKLDGQRFLIFSYNNHLYSISSKMKFNDLGIVPKKVLKETILDTEYYNGKYYIFDIIFVDSIDLRNNVQYKLKERLELINTVVSNIDSEFIVPKEYHIGNNYMISNYLIDNYFNNKNLIYDGIIFVPVNRTYPLKKNSNIPLKWKPLDQLTIDFKIKKIGSNNSDNTDTFKLLCSGGVPFTYPDYNGGDTVTINNNGMYMDNTVVEFRFDKESETFIPMRTRHDKKDGNYILIAQDNFKNTLFPFDFEYFNFNNVKREQSFFFDMRRYHNWIKSKLLDKYSRNTHSLLDLACGKGGDIHKWVNNNIKTVEGFDINKDSIVEAQRRSTNVKLNPVSKNFDMTFTQLDLSKDTIQLNSSTHFDTLTCFFALHYFFKDQGSLTNFVKNTASLKIGGHFIITTFDDINLKNINYTLDTTKVKITPVNIQPGNTFGNSINVWIKNTVLDKPEVEYIINTEFLITFLKEHGFMLVDTVYFSDMYQEWTINKNSMNFLQKKLSFLNKGMVFKKIKDITVDEMVVDDGEMVVDDGEMVVDNGGEMVIDNGDDCVQELTENIEQINLDTTSSSVVVYTYDILKTKKNNDLKKICVDLQLRYTGKKNELIERILSSQA